LRNLEQNAGGSAENRIERCFYPEIPVMFRRILSFFLAAFLCSGCAFEGVIVEKRFRPLPFYDSLGVDAIYNFQLRDGAGQIHSQMVTAEVFASYRVGDYFNDLQAPPSPEGKEMRGFRPTPLEMNEGPYQPVRVMQMQPKPTRPSAKVAARVHHRAKRTAKSAKTGHRAKRTAKSTKAGHRAKRTAKSTKAGHRAKGTAKSTETGHRAKRTSKIAKSKHHVKKRAKVSGKHRNRNHKKIASAH
jgi:hypothetical protein